MKQVESTRIRRGSLTAFLFTLLIFAIGCAVLTPTQVKEVNKFATAAKSYGAFPGTVIQSHADIRKTQKMLEASTFTDGENALELIKMSLRVTDEFKKREEKADRALEILNNYAELLVNLTSDTYTNELQGSTENLGKAVDKGISTYNKENGTRFNLFGSITAGIVRGVGGIYIRNKQSRALKDAVTRADPIVKEMIAAVENLLVLYLNDEDLKNLNLTMEDGRKPLTLNLIRFAGKDLEEIYKNTVKLYGGKLPFETVSVVAEELEAVADTIQLAKDALKAAKAYREAHAELAENVKQKQSIKEMIEQIQVLSEEVKAAQKIKKKLDMK